MAVLYGQPPMTSMARISYGLLDFFSPPQSENNHIVRTIISHWETATRGYRSAVRAGGRTVLPIRKFAYGHFRRFPLAVVRVRFAFL